MTRERLYRLYLLQDWRTLALLKGLVDRFRIAVGNNGIFGVITA